MIRSSTPMIRSSTDPSGTTLYCHDHRGNVTARFWNDGIGPPLVTQYRYTRGDRLAGISYPSGREVEWLRDSGGRIGLLPVSWTPWQTAPNLLGGAKAPMG